MRTRLPWRSYTSLVLAVLWLLTVIAMHVVGTHPDDDTTRLPQEELY